MRILIVGGSGLLGRELVRQATAAGCETAATYCSRPGKGAEVSWYEVDLRASGRLEQVLATVEPDAVIDVTSGYGDWAVTADGSIRVALAAAESRCHLVHVSSDAVFSGSAVHYEESCLPDPVTPYGAAKAAAETAVRLLTPAAVVARTSLIVGNGVSEHERLVHDLCAGNRTGDLFTDDIRCPVHVEDLAGALLELSAPDSGGGVFHVAGADALSRYELGVLIARRDGLDAARLRPGRRADTSLPGAVDVRLGIGVTQRRLGTRLRGAREFLSPQQGEGRLPTRC